MDFQQQPWHELGWQLCCWNCHTVVDHMANMLYALIVGMLLLPQWPGAWALLVFSTTLTPPYHSSALCFAG
jgi:hypothetical protein